MNCKVSLYDLKTIIRDTPTELKGKKLSQEFGYRNYEKIGWYKKSSANWYYDVYAVNYSDRYKDVMLLVTVGDIIE